MSPNRRRLLRTAAAACLACFVGAPSAFPDDLPHPVAPSGGSAKEVTVPVAARDKASVLPATEEPLDYDTPRFEPAAFPLLGGDSDIGFEFGPSTLRSTGATPV